MNYQSIILFSIVLASYTPTPGDNEFLFRPDSETLCIITTRGDTLAYRDTLDPQYAEDYVYHTLYSYLPEQNYWLILKTYYEGGSWLLVNGASGIENIVTARPILSPDGTRLACFNANLQGVGYNFNEIELWRIDTDSLILEFRNVDLPWSPMKATWKNDSTLIFEKCMLDENWECVTHPGQLVLSGSGTWVPADMADWDSPKR